MTKLGFSRESRSTCHCIGASYSPILIPWSAWLACHFGSQGHFQLATATHQRMQSAGESREGKLPLGRVGGSNHHVITNSPSPISRKETIETKNTYGGETEKKGRPKTLERKQPCQSCYSWIHANPRVAGSPHPSGAKEVDDSLHPPSRSCCLPTPKLSGIWRDLSCAACHTAELDAILLPAHRRGGSLTPSQGRVAFNAIRGHGAFEASRGLDAFEAIRRPWIS